MTIRLSPGSPGLFIIEDKLVVDLGEADVIFGISESVGGLLHMGEEVECDICESEQIFCCIEGSPLRASRHACGMVHAGQIVGDPRHWQCDSWSSVQLLELHVALSSRGK